MNEIEEVIPFDEEDGVPDWITGLIKEIRDIIDKAESEEGKPKVRARDSRVLQD